MDQDNELIDRYATGDREAFNALVEKHQKPLYALLYRMVSNHDDAADLLQKTFIKAFTGLSGFEGRSSFKTWLYQIAINLAKNTYRDRAKMRQVPIEDIIVSQDPKTLDSLIKKQQRLLLRQSLNALPEKQRMTLILRVQDNKKFDEIAQIMHCSLSTAKTNYHHAVQKLKALMKEQRAAEFAKGGQ
jgi:RNA polymerase sigma-70 factor, ECF subfamily